MTGTIYQLNVSNGGVPKLPVASAHVGALGLEGDAHRSPQHGGPERAVCLYSLELIERLRAEGHPIVPGAAGENVTLRGIDFGLVIPGTRLYLGPEVVVEVTRYTTPCVNIAAAFKDGDFSRISHTTHPGQSRVHARVIEGGRLSVGDAVQVAKPALAAGGTIGVELSDRGTQRSDGA